MKAIQKAGEACAKQNLDTEANILDFFRQQGMIIIEDPDRAAFAEYAKNSYQTESKEVSKDWNWGLYDKIQALRP
jgi:TRAP-type C4-dicarboxylate transport system substrate-binding protein